MVRAMRHVIVGGGAAGLAAAKTIKTADYNADVVMISAERCLPYQRFRLTDYLCDNLSEDDLFHTSQAFFAEMDIALIRGREVVRVLPDAKSVVLDCGSQVKYDRLLIATGRLPALDARLRPFQRHIHPYYTFEDAVLLKRRLPCLDHIVVSGRGVSKLDLIHAMRRLGKRVTYIIRGSTVDVPLATPEINEGVDALLVDKGVEIVREDRLVDIEEAPRGYRVVTEKGRSIDADIVFASVSFEPNLGCIRDSGLEARNGILVDQAMNTSIRDIYGAGDCVEVFHPEQRNYWIGYGWPNALQQGVVAGRNMVGIHEEYLINETIAFNLLGKSLTTRWWS